METNQAKNFVLQLGSLIGLYVSLSAILMLLFGVINLRYPDEAAGIFEDSNNREAIRASIAMLVVFFPAYLILTRVSNQIRRKTIDSSYSLLIKWLLYLSLLLGGILLAADLVTIINYFLNGEITTRFVMKAFVFFAIVSAAFTYYLYDIRGFFIKNERKSLEIGAVTLIFVAASVIAGFLYIESPAAVREIRLDEQQVQDLQNIQWRIEEYYLVRGGFPESLDDLFIGERVPKAPEGRENYTYVLTGEKTYQLCATFAYESQNLGRYPNPVFPMKSANNVWDHGEGMKCFDRVIESKME